MRLRTIRTKHIDKIETDGGLYMKITLDTSHVPPATDDPDAFFSPEQMLSHLVENHPNLIKDYISEELEKVFSG